MEETYSFQIQRFRFLDNLYEILSQVSTATQAELTYKSEIERLYIVGTRDQVKDAACRICEFDYLTVTFISFSFKNVQKQTNRYINIHRTRFLGLLFQSNFLPQIKIL